MACDENGLAVFERLRCKRAGRHVFLYAFDLLELNGTDLRLEPIETRKATFASVLRGCLPGLRLNEHLACPSCCRRTASTAHFRAAASAEIRPTCPRRVAAARPSFQRRCAQPALGGRRRRGDCGIFRATIIGALDVLGFSLSAGEFSPRGFGIGAEAGPVASSLAQTSRLGDLAPQHFDLGDFPVSSVSLDRRQHNCSQPLPRGSAVATRGRLGRGQEP